MSGFETPKPVNSQEKSEKEKIIEQDEKMRLSGKLIERPILDGEPGYDKIFLLGEIQKGEGEWTIDIKSDTPTVALNDDIKNEFGLNDSPNIKEAREKKIASNLSLISGGSFVWLTQHGSSELLLLRRDMNAPVDAGCLTGPAGRCGEAPSLTTVNESNEELVIVRAKTEKGGERFKLLGFYGDESMKETVIHQKLRQVKTIHDLLLAQGKTEEAKFLQLIRGEDDIEMFSMKQTKKRAEQTDKVVTRVDGKVIDVIENGVVFFDNAVNTLEIREIVDIELPRGTEIAKILDGEIFGRDILTSPSLEMLKGERLVAALQDYYQRVKGGS